MSVSDLAEATLGSMSQTVRRLEQLAYITKSRGTGSLTGTRTT
jgi:DNA-binding MarR family transcriptional regulator